MEKITGASSEIDSFRESIKMLSGSFTQVISQLSGFANVVDQLGDKVKENEKSTSSSQQNDSCESIKELESMVKALEGNRLIEKNIVQPLVVDDNTNTSDLSTPMVEVAEKPEGDNVPSINQPGTNTGAEKASQNEVANAEDASSSDVNDCSQTIQDEKVEVAGKTEGDNVPSTIQPNTNTEAEKSSQEEAAKAEYADSSDYSDLDEDLKYYNYAFTDIKTKPKKPKTNDAAGKSVENPEKKKETRVYKSERRDPIEHFINDIYRAIDHLKKTQSVAANASKMRTILNEIPEHMILANFADYRELLRLLHKFHLLEESRR